MCLEKFWNQFRNESNIINFLPFFPRSTNNNRRTSSFHNSLSGETLLNVHLISVVETWSTLTLWEWIRSARQHFQSLCVEMQLTLFKGRKIKKSFLLFLSFSFVTKNFKSYYNKSKVGYSILHWSLEVVDEMMKFVKFCQPE